jgi:hypothetical protein
MGKLYDLYKADPKSALLHVLREGEERAPYGHRWALVYQAYIGIDGAMYGSYRHLGLKDLAGRTYAIEFWDDAVSVLWLDHVHDVTRPWPDKSTPIETAALPARWPRK